MGKVAVEVTGPDTSVRSRGRVTSYSCRAALWSAAMDATVSASSVTVRRTGWVLSLISPRPANASRVSWCRASHPAAS